MAHLPEHPIRNRDDITRFEAEMSLAQRLPERSVLDVFIARRCCTNNSGWKARR